MPYELCITIKFSQKILSLYKETIDAEYFLFYIVWSILFY